MKKLYFILPLVGILAFTVVYHRHEVAAQATATRIAAEKAEVLAKAETARLAAEKLAREDAEKRRVTREAEELARETERQTRAATELAHIEEETKAYQAKTAELAPTQARLEQELTALHSEKEQAREALFSAEKTVAGAQIERRKTDQENQRLIGQIEARSAGRANP